MRHSLDTNGRSAAFSMLLAMVIIGCIDNYIAMIANQASLWQFQIVRALMAIPLVVLGSIVGLGTLWPKRLWAVAVRSGLMALAMIFYFGALAFMPIAQALAGLFTSPIFVLLITAFILKQSVGPMRVFAVALGFVGIVLVLNTGLDSFRLISLLPVVGGFLYALGAVATRQLCEEESTLSMLLMMLIFQGLIGTAALIVVGVIDPVVPAGAEGFMLRSWVWPLDQVFHLIVLQAVGSVIGVGFLIRSYQLGDASYVSVLEYSVFIFGPFFGWVLLGQTVGGVQMIGIALVALAGIIIALRSAKSSG